MKTDCPVKRLTELRKLSIATDKAFREALSAELPITNPRRQKKPSITPSKTTKGNKP